MHRDARDRLITPMELRHAVATFLVAFLYPLWLVAGFFDYVFHRKTDIERTSGPTESWLHLAQLGSLAMPLALAVWCQVTFTVFAILVACIALHTVLSVVDTRYTESRRYISPLEQHMHGFLVVLPVVAVGLVALLDWTGVGAGSRGFQLRTPPIPAAQAATLVGSFLLLGGIPILEELLRTLRQLDTGGGSPGHVAHADLHPDEKAG